MCSPCILTHEIPGENSKTERDQGKQGPGKGGSGSIDDSCLL